MGETDWKCALTILCMGIALCAWMLLRREPR